MNKYVGSFVRTGLAALAGFVISKGFPEEAAHSAVDAAAPVLTGAILYGVAQLWSLVEKKVR